jgi:tetratricopeptide (TPR) repeat protein
MKHATDPAGTAARMNALWSGATNLAMRLRVVDLEAGLLGPAAGLSRLELLPEPDRGQSDAVIAHAAMLARMSNWSGMVTFLDSALPQAAKDPGALADLETESRLAKATGGTNEFVHPLADQAMVLAWKVCAQRNAGDVEGGRATTRLLAAAVERRPVLALAAARQLYLWGMYDAAADAVRFAVERRTPGRFYLLDLACSASAAANRMDDAIQYAEAMVAMNPRDYAARSNLALYLLESGSDLKRGLTLAAEVRQANLDNPFFHDLYALALALNGRADEALREHGKMQADVLSNPRMRFTRARILALQGRVDDARKMAEPIQPEMVLVYQRTALRRLQEPGAVPARAK